jgi:hypothetical protein
MATKNLGKFASGSTFGATALAMITSPNVFAATTKSTGAPFSDEGTTLPFPVEESPPAKALPINRDEYTETIFRKFVREWVDGTRNISDASIVLTHPSYSKILAMGTSVLPYIFDDLAAGDGAKWLPALDAITLGLLDPISPEHEDDAEAMCQDWLDWWNGNERIA